MHRHRTVSHHRVANPIRNFFSSGVNRGRRWLVVFVILAAIAGWCVWYLKFAPHHLTFQGAKVGEGFWGVTFSKKYALELGLDWRASYEAILDDLGVRYVRIPLYWDDIEPARGEFDFSAYDWMFDEAERRGVKVIPAIGRRLPRWPECHEPEWTTTLSEDAMNKRHVLMTATAIDHLKSRKEILYWQLENEYFLPWFGLCPRANEAVLEVEIRYLRSVDSRPILLTESGEFNTWLKASRFSDILGTTMYRVVWNKYFGYMRMPWPAWWYKSKAAVIGRQPSRAIIAELQAEPWPAHFKNVTQIDHREAEKSFSLAQFETNSELARRTGFAQAYFWGVEWWYWLKVHGDSSFWDAGREIIKTSL